MPRINTKDLLEMVTTQPHFEISFITRNNAEMNVEDYDIRWTIISGKRRDDQSEWVLSASGFRKCEGKPDLYLGGHEFLVPDQTVRYYDDPYNCSVEVRGRLDKINLEIYLPTNLTRGQIRDWCFISGKTSWEEEKNQAGAAYSVVDTREVFKFASIVRIDREIEDNEVLDVERTAEVGQGEAWFLQTADKSWTIPHQKANLYDTGRMDARDLDGNEVRILLFKEAAFTGFDLSEEQRENARRWDQVQTRTGSVTVRVTPTAGPGDLVIAGQPEPRPLEFGKPGPPRKLTNEDYDLETDRVIPTPREKKP